MVGDSLYIAKGGILPVFSWVSQASTSPGLRPPFRAGDFSSIPKVPRGAHFLQSWVVAASDICVREIPGKFTPNVYSPALLGP